jgi:hypothetical protein
LAALLREMEAAVPQIDWRDAFARRPMLVCHAKATLKRNWDTCVHDSFTVMTWQRCVAAAP